MNEKQSILQRVKLLAPREYEILTYVISGMLNKQIAYEPDINEKTVKAYRGRVMAKMNADSLAELVRNADKVGINSINKSA